MERFVHLFDQLDQTKSTKEKIRLMKEYFGNVSSEDAIWALFFLSGHRLKRLIGSSKLFEWCIEASSLPQWLVLEAYGSVGDLAETIALLIAPKEKNLSRSSLSLSHWIVERILPLQNLPAEEQKEKIIHYWQELDHRGILILNKILTGSFRIGVSHLTTIQALSQALTISRELLNQKLMGQWSPTAEFFESLKATEEFLPGKQLNPYPFYLASPLTGPLEELGSPDEWVAEWKWDGIRAQCVKRGGEVALWSRGNEWITHQFPELVESFKKLEDGTVLDGEILAYKAGKPLSFNELQKRLGRKKVSKAMIEAVPVVFMIYDLLEYRGDDFRKHSYIQRRHLFENWDFIDPKILVSPQLPFSNWEEINKTKEEAYHNATEGLILKKKSSLYGMGRRRGNWWKYKIDPKTIDAILLYAQPGQGWRANLYTDYTFAVWHEGELVPIAKAYSGLTQEEILKLDKWIRKNTLEKFGPVRKVKPEQVFEIAFEGIQLSSRHKSGVAFRFPRIQRWRNDKPPSECETLRKNQIRFS